jgi:hypothetical protein
LRRLACDCGRIELKDLSEERDEARLVEAMGRETANIHQAAQRSGPKLLRDLARRPKSWLLKTSARMEETILAEHKQWAREWKGLKHA